MHVHAKQGTKFGIVSNEIELTRLSQP